MGLDAASAALSRAAIDLALREAISRHPNIRPPKEKRDWDLLDLIDAAHSLRILDNYSKDMAHQIRMIANDILHTKRTKDLRTKRTKDLPPEAILLQARAIVERVASAAVLDGPVEDHLN
jgi:hypothetical protein